MLHQIAMLNITHDTILFIHISLLSSMNKNHHMRLFTYFFLIFQSYSLIRVNRTAASMLKSLMTQDLAPQFTLTGTASRSKIKSCASKGLMHSRGKWVYLDAVHLRNFLRFEVSYSSLLSPCVRIKIIKHLTKPLFKHTNPVMKDTYCNSSSIWLDCVW